MQLCRDVIAALLPPGALWVPEDNGELDLLLDGMAANHETVRSVLENLARTRNAQHTTVLDDLEREYGILPNWMTDESVRRTRLAAVKAARSSDGTLSFMQSALRSAGFDVTVHANTPAVDPGFFLSYTPDAIFGDSTAMFGRSGMGAERGELIVNGAHDTGKYSIPAAAGYWPLFFFVGGAATRDGGGSLTAIDDAVVPAARRSELVQLITRYKPMYTWAGLIARYV